MQLKGKGAAISGAWQSVYRNERRKSDRPRHWSWNHKAKPGKCKTIRGAKAQAFLPQS